MPDKVSENTLIVITGPTGVGKTDIAIQLAKRYGTEIISADSRQLYRDIPIGTAAPSASQLAEVQHHFIGTLALDEYYSAAQFETDALKCISHIFQTQNYAVMCGGSMLYVDAVCKGIDDIPTISEQVRNEVLQKFEEHGIDALRQELKLLDPTYYNQVDLLNSKRVIHAVEICRQAGIPYSELRKNEVKQRPFCIKKIGLTLPRERLFDRINRRVLQMTDSGLIEEARHVYPNRHLNSLNTVGFKELFAWMDGKMDLDIAIARIQKNTRVYAKKQLTWFKKDDSIQWFTPNEIEDIIRYIDE